MGQNKHEKMNSKEIQKINVNKQKKCKHETGSWMAQTDIQSAMINIKLLIDKRLYLFDNTDAKTLLSTGISTSCRTEDSISMASVIKICSRQGFDQITNPDHLFKSKLVK